MSRRLTVLWMIFTTLLAPAVMAAFPDFVDIRGVVWSLDDHKLLLKDSRERIWSVPRRLLKNGIALRPGQKIAVHVRRGDYSERSASGDPSHSNP